MIGRSAGLFVVSAIVAASEPCCQRNQNVFERRSSGPSVWLYIYIFLPEVYILGFAGSIYVGEVGSTSASLRSLDNRGFWAERNV